MIGCFLVLVVAIGTTYADNWHPLQSDTTFVMRTLENEGLKSFMSSQEEQPLVEWPLSAWTLPQLTEAAFYYHPDLDVARARLLTSQAAVRTASARPNLYAQFTPQYLTSRVTGVTSPWTFPLITGIPIETAGKRKHRIHQAEHLSDSARWGIAQAAWRVRSRLRVSVISQQILTQQEVLLEGQWALQQQRVALLQRRYEVGEAADAEVITAQLAAQQAAVTLEDIKRQRQQAMAQVANAVGVPLEALQATTLLPINLDERPIIANNSQEGVSQAFLLGEALHHRADLMALMADYQASHEALKLEIAKKYPDIRLGPAYTWDKGHQLWAAASYLVFPSYYQSGPMIHEMGARQHEVATRFEALQAQVVGEVERALVGYENALKGLEASALAVTLQEQHHQTVQRQLDEGEVDRLALITSQLEVGMTQLGYLNAMTLMQQSLGLLEDAVQQPLTPQSALPSFSDQSPRAPHE
jgi:outer membrane protein TolC